MSESEMGDIHYFYKNIGLSAKSSVGKFSGTDVNRSLSEEDYD